MRPLFNRKVPGEGGRGRLLLGEAFVLLESHQPLELLGVLDLQLHEPPLAVRVHVDHRGVLEDALVDAADGAGDGRGELDDGLLGFDLAEGVALLEEFPDLAQGGGDDLPQLLLRVVGKAEPYGLSHLENPDVILGESHGGLIHAGLVYRESRRDCQPVSE